MPALLTALRSSLCVVARVQYPIANRSPTIRSHIDGAFMHRYLIAFILALFLIAPTSQTARAAITPQDLRKLYDRATPSLVAVQFIWESELGRRELVGAGVVISDDGLVLTSMQMFDLRMPDAQMKEFKIIIPSQTAEH